VVLDKNLKIKIGSKTGVPKDRVEVLVKNLKDISQQAQSEQNNFGSWMSKPVQWQPSKAWQI